MNSSITVPLTSSSRAHRICLIVVGLAAAARMATGDQPVPDKTAYTLFNPTPDELLRDLAPDRPDTTESPYTVDAGRVQIESSFITYTRNGDLERLDLLNTNLKLGLTNNADLQLVFTPYVKEDVDDAGTLDGFDDVQLRLKVNLWGNDAGDSAFGVMPYVQLPAGDDQLSSDHVEGGLIVAFAQSLAPDVGLGLMGEIDFVYDEVDDHYFAQFVHTAAIGKDLLENVGVYVEYIGIASSDSDPGYQALVGVGMTFKAGRDLIFDAGVNIGLTGDADDLSVFSGVTVRF